MDLLEEKYFEYDRIHAVRTTMLEQFLESIKEYGTWKGSLGDALTMFNELVANGEDICDGFKTCWNIIKDRLDKNSKLDTWFLLLKDIDAMTEEIDSSGKRKNVFYFPTNLVLGDKSTYWMCKLDNPAYLKVDHSRAEIAVAKTLKTHWNDLTEEGKIKYKNFKQSIY